MSMSLFGADDASGSRLDLDRLDLPLADCGPGVSLSLLRILGKGAISKGDPDGRERRAPATSTTCRGRRCAASSLGDHTASVREKWLDFSPEFLSLYAKWDPGMMVQPTGTTATTSCSCSKAT